LKKERKSGGDKPVSTQFQKRLTGKKNREAGVGNKTHGGDRKNKDDNALRNHLEGGGERKKGVKKPDDMTSFGRGKIMGGIQAKIPADYPQKEKERN